MQHLVTYKNVARLSSFLMQVFGYVTDNFE